ncbi:hypothetical protein ZWY2020_008816 [Hordeum vulgare]|nr:hypothetical protein ZWY2020_008816 [Hordeum vulgare]
MGGAAASRSAASIGEEDDAICGDHLSGNYKGVCWGLWSNGHCNSVCIGESSDNISGSCKLYKCWCKARCTSSEIGAAAASAPTSIQP